MLDNQKTNDIIKKKSISIGSFISILIALPLICVGLYHIQDLNLTLKSVYNFFLIFFIISLIIIIIKEIITKNFAIFSLIHYSIKNNSILKDTVFYIIDLILRSLFATIGCSLTFLVIYGALSIMTGKLL